ncbi:NACHT domain-containing NTPase [Vibrio splendidus]
MAFEEKVALEAIKPVGGIFSALIAPKVEKVKKWAEKRELKSQLDPEALSDTLNNYLNTLSSRVSVISSICFPQKEYSIDQAYEPLFVEEFNSRNNEKLSVDHLVSNIQESCLIVDGAGMGKSTFSKFLITQILYKSDRIPVLFELRKSKPDVDLIESIASELDPLGRVFSRELFYELIKEGKFVIVLDGFDEVEYERQSEVAEQINDISVKGQRNSLILTTRPQELVPSVLDSKSYQFSQFTSDQAKQLINRLDSISGLDIGKKLTLELGSVPDDFLENPLLVSLLYSTFGANNTIADRICTFYNDIYDALYKGHDLINKNGFKRKKISELDYEHFRVLLRALCFQMSLKRKASFSTVVEAHEYINKAATLSKVSPKSANTFLNDLLNAVPLMQKDGSDTKFLHKTIIEYFAAEYIVYHPDSETILSKMFESKAFTSFGKIFDFVYELSSTTYDKVVTTKYANAIRNSFDLSTTNKAILSTATHLAYIKIGLFPVNEIYSKKGRDNASSQINMAPLKKLLSKDDSDHGGLLGIASTIIESDGQKYFLTLVAKNKANYVHKVAWLQLTDDYDDSDQVMDASNDEGLLSLLGSEKFYDAVDYIDQLSQFDSAASLFAHYLPGIGLSRKQDLEERVLSSSKIDLFLDSMKAQNEMASELSDLLEL